MNKVIVVTKMSDVGGWWWFGFVQCHVENISLYTCIKDLHFKFYKNVCIGKKRV